MAPQLTLYHAKHACSTVVKVLLEDLGLTFKEVKMRMGPHGIESEDGTLDRAAYLKIHHLGYVPCLVADGDSITEMPAILYYIAQLVPEKRLLGDNLLEQSLVLGWCAWLAGALHGRGFGALFRPERYTDEESAHPRIKEMGRNFVEQCYDSIESRLEGREFPVGSHETVVDFNLFIFWLWGLEQRIDMAKVYPNYGRVIERLLKKDSVRSIDKYAKPALLYEGPDA